MSLLETRDRLADEWKHETDCTVSQCVAINLVQSKSLTSEFCDLTEHWGWSIQLTL